MLFWIETIVESAPSAAAISIRPNIRGEFGCGAAIFSGCHHSEQAQFAHFSNRPSGYPLSRPNARLRGASFSCANTRIVSRIARCVSDGTMAILLNSNENLFDPRYIMIVRSIN